MTKSFPLGVALALAAGLPCAAQTIGPEVVFTEVATAPLAKRQVPGLVAGTVFESTTAGAALDRPYRSGNGQFWVIKASSNLATTEDDVILLVDLSCAGTGCGYVVAREGTLTPFDGTRNWGLFDQRCSVNNSGSVVFANDIAGATTDDELIAKYTFSGGPVFDSLPCREGVATTQSPLPTGARYGITIDSANITNGGDVGAVVNLFVDAATTPPVTTTNDRCVLLGANALAQEATTTFTGGVNTFQTCFAGDLHVDATGANWLVLGDESTVTNTDGIVVVNGTVVLREGTTVIPTLANPLPATSTAGLTEAAMSPGGDWYCRGNTTDVDEDYVVRNGVVIACRKAGHPLNPIAGGAELWGNTDFTATFFLMCGNSLGDYIIGGVTDAALTNNAVLVLDRAGVRSVVAREGDPIDLDDNGIYDDNVYIRTFGNDDVFLTDDGWLYFGATFTATAGVGSTGTDVGDAILRLRVFTPSTSTCYANCDGSTIIPFLNVNDFTCFLNKFAANDPVANCDGSTTAPVLNVNDFLCFLNVFAAGCSAP
ncbi:MAG: GC-type dockerin domain-anchored protein [Phycisphaerales bacterium]